MLDPETEAGGICLQAVGEANCKHYLQLVNRLVFLDSGWWTEHLVLQREDGLPCARDVHTVKLFNRSSRKILPPQRKKCR